MKINVLFGQGDGVFIDNYFIVDKRTYIKWYNSLSDKQKQDSWLTWEHNMPLLYEEEYKSYLNFKQNILIDKLLK